MYLVLLSDIDDAMMANEMKSMKLDTTHDVSYYIMLTDPFYK